MLLNILICDAIAITNGVIYQTIWIARLGSDDNATIKCALMT